LADEHPLRDAGRPRDLVAERLGHALQSLATDLAEQHRQMTVLKRENAKLRAELSALRGKQ
jgi:cell division protein FtsB